jgi:hypothetical protein
MTHRPPRRSRQRVHPRGQGARPWSSPGRAHHPQWGPNRDEPAPAVATDRAIVMLLAANEPISHPTPRSRWRARGIGRQSRDDSSYEDRRRAHRPRKYRVRSFFSRFPRWGKGGGVAPDQVTGGRRNEIPVLRATFTPPSLSAAAAASGLFNVAIHRRTPPRCTPLVRR